MRRFHCHRLPTPKQNVLLDQQTSHHILRVVGIAPKESVELFNGQGSGCVAHLIDVTQGLATMGWVSALELVPSRPELTLVLALTKGDAFATAIRMTTEMGVSQIIPLQAQRSIAKGDKQERWQKIANGAAAQSKRLTIPIIYPLQTWGSLWSEIPIGQRWVLHPSDANVEPVTKIFEPTVLFIGPEGGFTDKEVSVLLENGCKHRSLGSLVLKADTAAIVATSMSI